MNKKAIFLQIMFIIFLILPAYIYPISTYAYNYIGGGSTNLSQQSLTSDSVEIKVKAIERVLSRYNSPLSLEAESFVRAALVYDLDCFLLPSIAGVESTFGKNIAKKSYNPFGWGGGRVKFSDWADAIITASRGLRKGYMDAGVDNLADISKIYCPPQADVWKKDVEIFMKKFYNEEREVQQSILLNQ